MFPVDNVIVKRWWWIGALVLVVVIGFVIAAFKQPTDDIGSLRKYVASIQIQYFRRSHGIYGPTRVTEAELKNVPAIEVESFTNDKLAHGWKKYDWAFRVLYRGKSVQDYSQSTMIVGPVAGPTSGRWDININEMQPLSPMEVWLVRLKNVGHDPFKD